MMQPFCTSSPRSHAARVKEFVREYQIAHDAFARALSRGHEDQIAAGLDRMKVLEFCVVFLHGGPAS